MNIAFSDFWQYPKAFDPNNNFFIHVIRQLFEGVPVVLVMRMVDIITVRKFFILVRMLDQILISVITL